MAVIHGIPSAAPLDPTTMHIVAGLALVAQNTLDAASNQVATLGGGNRSTPADGDEGYLSLLLDNNLGAQTEFARVTWRATDVTNSTKDSFVKIESMSGNVLNGPYIGNYGSPWVSIGGTAAHDGGTEILLPQSDAPGVDFYIGYGAVSNQIISGCNIVLQRNAPQLMFQDIAGVNVDYSITNNARSLTLAPASQAANLHFIVLDTSVSVAPSFVPVSGHFTHGFVGHTGTWSVAVGGAFSMVRFAPTVTWSASAASISCVSDAATITQTVAGGAATMLTFASNRVWNYAGTGDMPFFDTFAEYGSIVVTGTPAVGATRTLACIHNRRAFRATGGSANFVWPTMSSLETDITLEAAGVGDSITITEFDDVWSKPSFNVGAGTKAITTRNVVLAVNDPLATNYNVIRTALAAAATRRVINSTGTAQSDHVGKFFFGGEIEVDGALNHDGSTIGFYGVAPVARPAAYTQTYATATRTHAAPTAAVLTDSSGGSATQTVGAVAGSGADTAINDNFASVTDEINKLIADVANVKQVLNQSIDDDQLQGLKQ